MSAPTMNGRTLAWIVLAILGLALLGQSLRAVDRTVASVELQRAETRAMEAARMGKAGTGLLRANLELLKDAAARDPLTVGIPIATGSVHLLLGSPQVASEWYQKALAIEPRPETYLNLGRAQVVSGNPEAARESFAKALKLDPLLAPQIPAALRPPEPPSP